MAAELARLDAAAKHLNKELQDAHQKMEEPEIADLGIDPTKLCYTPFCHSVFFGGEKWDFHSGAEVVAVLLGAYLKRVDEVHTDDISAALTPGLRGKPLSQIFKGTTKDARWKKLIIAGKSGKGFYRLNPQYLENGVKEISLGLTSSKPKR